jgi:hypothetical protein
MAARQRRVALMRNEAVAMGTEVVEIERRPGLIIVTQWRVRMKIATLETGYAAPP